MLDRRRTILLSVLTGVALEVSIQALSGRREAWDSSAYWTLGLPVVAIAAFLLGILARGTAWRWAILIIPSQVATMMVMSGEISNLWPLAIVLGLILESPFFVVAYVGSRLRRKA